MSVDALNPSLFREMSNSSVEIHTVLRGIERALMSGFNPVKVNMVVRRGVNEQEIVPMARHFSVGGYVLRFIEYMDVGTTNGWRLSEVFSAREVREVLDAEFGVDPLPQIQGGDTAKRYRLRKTGGEIGVIASVGLGSPSIKDAKISPAIPDQTPPRDPIPRQVNRPGNRGMSPTRSHWVDRGSIRRASASRPIIGIRSAVSERNPTRPPATAGKPGTGNPGISFENRLRF